MQEFDIVDTIATGFAAALMLLGIVGLGVVELLAGRPYSPVPLTNEAGDVIATPAVDPTLRTGLVLLGLAVLFAWGLYRATVTPGAPDRTPREVTAD
ncbi:hypothetical protein Hbl1158_00135 [Halobaculum sp. CBA1158]|uniref:hypothetical protein n=1 Tax=Halobaculum sp. CBA1158 TaxID=2904243 RepID=UPI001F197C3C|nr:hypothetical protein [Halobaculum sp. CBA1158]UIO99824.1 hypothetical protein Hbl1158_00135 [Halobaculum sp. CBA1158]